MIELQELGLPTGVIAERMGVSAVSVRLRVQRVRRMGRGEQVDA